MHHVGKSALEPGGLEQGGERNSHQYLRTDSSRLCAPNILQGQTRSSCPSTLTQHQCIVLHYEDGGTKSLDLFLAAKSLWEFCPENNITLTVDHLPGVLNKVSDWESRNQNSHSEWKLKPEIFHQIHKILCPLQADLFPSRINFQLHTSTSAGGKPSIFLENRCSYNPLGRYPGVRFPPIRSDSHSYGQDNKGESFNCLSNTTVADAALVNSP